MIVSLWNSKVLDPFVDYLERQSEVEVGIRRSDAQGCFRDLAEAKADVALLTSLHVLRHASRTLVVPGVGLASYEAYPPAKLYLPDRLDAIESLAFDPRDGEAVVLARLIAKEHYGQSPSFVPVPDASTPQAWGSAHGAIIVGEPEQHAAAEAHFPIALDLGREWYELTTRPMVWGLVATRHPTMSEKEHALLVQAASRLDELEEPDAGPDPTTIRSRLDEFSLQGLEEFANYLFLTGSLDEIPNLNFTALPGNDAVAGQPPAACGL